MIIVALLSRSPQIAAAARLVTLNWAFSLQLWLLADGAVLVLAYFVIDASTALVFYAMCRKRWFPVPLFFLHAVLALCHIGALYVIKLNIPVQPLLNRAFDLEVVYVSACGLFRLILLRRAMARARGGVDGRFPDP